jgi:hypothetical protein
MNSKNEVKKHTAITHRAKVTIDFVGGEFEVCLRRYVENVKCIYPEFQRFTDKSLSDPLRKAMKEVSE